MNLSLADIINAWDPLLRLSERELPIKNAFRLGRIIKVISEERQGIEEQKLKLFQKYGNADGDQVKVNPDKMPELLKEWNELLKQKIDIKIEPLDEDFFNEISYVNMTSREMSFLLPLMKDE